jgi:hypothetical protein
MLDASLIGGTLVAWLALAVPGAAQTVADQQAEPAQTETVERVVRFDDRRK